MKDWIGVAMMYIPQYIKDFGSLLSGPKRFMAQQNTIEEATFTRSLAFLGFSLALVVILQAPLLPTGTDLWIHAAGTGLIALLAVSLSAITLRFAWRLVGGKANVRSFFVTCGYFFGVTFSLVAFFQLLYAGVFKTFAPDLYTQIREADFADSIQLTMNSDSLVPLLSAYILVVGFALVSIWDFVAWGAYRALNDLSKWRSFVALLIMGALEWPLISILLFVSVAINPT